MADYYAITDERLAQLRALMTRLHSERRMDGDVMRDAGHLLDAIIRECESIPLDENEQPSHTTKDTHR